MTLAPRAEAERNGVTATKAMTMLPATRPDLLRTRVRVEEPWAAPTLTGTRRGLRCLGQEWNRKVRAPRPPVSCALPCSTSPDWRRAPLVPERWPHQNRRRHRAQTNGVAQPYRFAQFHGHGVRLGILHHVGQGSLRHPETFGLDHRIQALLQGVRPDFGLQAAQDCLPAVYQRNAASKPKSSSMDGRKFSERSCTCSCTRPTTSRLSFKRGARASRPAIAASLAGSVRRR